MSRVRQVNFKGKVQGSVFETQPQELSACVAELRYISQRYTLHWNVFQAAIMMCVFFWLVHRAGSISIGL
ncbi:LOW QUALITY PROTEIN: hypothetical protein HJFPF1_10959 [Paramyrothecium foliicola]|nr:LOW QUALITY PROTEIN: hypothetical protein HJFPF1_10959 [Paramyrothecium foliicola]